MLSVLQEDKAGQNNECTNATRSVKKRIFSNDSTKTSGNNYRREMADFQKEKALSGELNDLGQNSWKIEL